MKKTEEFMKRFTKLEKKIKTPVAFINIYVNSEDVTWKGVFVSITWGSLIDLIFTLSQSSRFSAAKYKIKTQGKANVQTTEKN